MANVNSISELNTLMQKTVCKLPQKQSLGMDISNEIYILKIGYIIKHFESNGFDVNKLYCMLR